MTSSPIAAARIQGRDYLRIEPFLSFTDHAHLLQLVEKTQGSFKPSTTTTGEPGFRRSYTLYGLPDFFPLFTELIDTCVPFVTRALGLSDFIPAEIEMQLTSHLDGGYFKRHRDNSNPKTARRVISYAYYFHKLPKSFEGGELVLTGLDASASVGSNVATSHTLHPIDNTIVFFRSELMHEIRPVLCSSALIVDGRLTLNGWLRR